MKRKIFWLVVSTLMALSLVMAACAPAATPTTPTTPTAPTMPSAPTTPAAPTTPVEKQVATPEAPKYGGTLTISATADITNFDASATTGGPTKDLTNQELWGGDWARGPAGGYGTNESSWTGNPDLFDQKAGVIAETTKWTVDTAKDEGTIVYQIRRGIRWALNPNSEASRLVGGRELTADDVVYNLKRTTGTINLSIYMATPELRTANITKTGPWEVTVKVPLTNLVTAVSRLGDSHFLVPPEVITKYGNMENWKNVVGSGPFILNEYVPGSQAVMVRNPNYWDKDPVGPGNGNQLPYLDKVNVLVITDASTRQAALRTGKVDHIGGSWSPGLTWEDAAQMRKTAPALKEAESGLANVFPMLINTQRTPFSDVRVRRAMLMSIDFESIRKNLNGGMGQILTFPMIYQKEYADLYIGLDDPKMPATVKELYVYNPTKAQQLLKDAGYPSGFKTSMLITSTDVDYYSVIKDMWRKVGIDLSFDVREAAAITPLRNAGTYDMTTGGKTPLAIFYLDQVFKPGAALNVSRMDDPIINDLFDKMRRAAINNLDEAMLIYRDMTKYALDQAYAIPRPSAMSTTFWWPWVKNYSGELTVGYFDATWPQWVWYDQTLKKSMGK